MSIVIVYPKDQHTNHPIPTKPSERREGKQFKSTISNKSNNIEPLIFSTRNHQFFLGIKYTSKIHRSQVIKMSFIQIHKQRSQRIHFEGFIQSNIYSSFSFIFPYSQWTVFEDSERDERPSSS